MEHNPEPSGVSTAHFAVALVTVAIAPCGTQLTRNVSLSTLLYNVMQHNLMCYFGTACCTKYELRKSQVVPSRASFIILEMELPASSNQL